MSSTKLLGISLVLFLVGLPLISFGSTGLGAVAMWLGILVIIVGAALPPVARLASWTSINGDSDES